jgi:hypothetical protein
MRRQVDKGLDDPATRVLAMAVISGNFDDARDPRSGEMVPVVPFYGRWFRGARSWEEARTVCGMRDDMCAITAIWNFIVINTMYAQDSAGSDDYPTLRATLEQGGDDCDGMAIALATLLKAVGFENVIFRIVSTDAESWQHVYVVVMLPQTGQWIALDPTERGHVPGSEYRNIKAKRDFAV